jgi:hypothetical protein
MLGPASFTFLDEAGLLVDGHTSPPTMLMAYNPPYYRPLLGGTGCTPIQDLYAWRLDASTQPPQDLVAVARSAEGHYRFRSADRRHPDQEQRRFLEVINAAFAHHWGLRPLTEAAPRPRDAASAAQRPWRLSFVPAAQATAIPGRTVDTAVGRSLAGHRGRIASPTNPQLSTHDRLSGTHTSASSFSTVTSSSSPSTDERASYSLDGPSSSIEPSSL